MVWAVFLEDRKLLLSRSSSSSNNPFFWFEDVIDGLLAAGLLDLLKVSYPSSSSLKRELFFGWVPICRGCLGIVFGKVGIDGPPKG